MSSSLPLYHSSNPICQWCSHQTNPIQQGKCRQHKICTKCILNDKTCQSDCPYCWYINAGEFICQNKICSVCCSGINPDDQPFPCSEKHYHCSQCLSEGCILCQFHKLNLWNNTIFRDLPANYQRILYACDTWQSKFEKSIPNNSKFVHSNGQYNLNDPLLLDIDNKSQVDSGSSSSNKSENNSKNNEETNDCMVCLEGLGSSYERLKICGHTFHKSCIDTWFQSSGKQSCPTCGYVYKINKGPQPSNGQMRINYISTVLPGYENEKYGHKEGPTIEISYSFPSGIQGPLNPNPGRPYSGTSRRAYLPNNKEGKDILRLLQRAFDDQHIFTIGRSTTTGQDNVITWNDIHHKTSIYGGSDRFGYPDPTYLYRIRQELADKGYK